MQVFSSFMAKLKWALRSDRCSYCQGRSVSSEFLCNDCRKLLQLREGMPLIEKGTTSIYAASTFNNHLKQRLYPYKFYHRHDEAELLSDILIDYWRTLSLPAIEARQTIVIPIPSRWRSNHLAPFARRFANHFGYGYSEQLLRWTRETEPQHTLAGKHRRWSNVRNSMAVVESAWEFQKKQLSRQCLIKNQDRSRIVIVDDMLTTGATLHEATQAFDRLSTFHGQTTALTLCYIPFAPQGRATSDQPENVDTQLLWEPPYSV